MELSSGCLSHVRPVGKPVRGPHGGWQKQEIDALQKSIGEAAQTGESLRSVFDRMSRELGRKPNSIRNFYYAQVRSQADPDGGRALPFETFTQDEVEQLIERVITARAQGMSVRACVRKMAEGDKALMLRYQNKYRSTIRTRPELVRRVMERLSSDGVAYVSPYADQCESAQNALGVLADKAQQSGDPKLSQLISSLDYLMTLALSPKEETPAETNPCEEPSVPADSEAQRRADRLSARLDMLRIALDDEHLRRKQLSAETEGMVTLIREYIGLPQDARIQCLDSFCQQAAMRLSSVECALMQPES